MDSKTLISWLERCYQPGGNNTMRELAQRISLNSRERVTRNSISGLYNRYPSLRNRFPLQASTGGRPRGKSDKSPAYTTTRIREVSPVQQATATLTSPLPEPPEQLYSKPVEVLGRYTLLELPYGHCKWPCHGGLFCGDSVGDDQFKPYCTYHARIAYVPRAVRMEQAIKRGYR